MKKGVRAVLFILMVILTAGCSRGKEPASQGQYIYYVNAEGTSLVKQEYKMSGAPAEKEIEEMLAKMQAEPESIDYKSAFPKELKIRDWSLSDTKLDIHFNTFYSEMEAAREVLLRAAVVKSLVQIAGVDYVDFFVEEEPLMDLNGQEIGFMRAEDFVQNTGSSLHSYQVANLQLYFTNEKGDALVKEEVSVRYNSNISVEKLTVEQLIKGPASDKARQVIPPDTKVLGVSVKDNICYVNFDKGFLGTGLVAAPEITVYSIVNSIIEGGTAGQVQISVNGETNFMYQGQVDLSKPFSRNLDIVEETKE